MIPPLVALAAIANAGGEGKTTLALLLEAILELLGHNVRLLDIDEGNGALSIARQPALGIGWGLNERAAGRLFAELNGSSTVIDFGANTFASGAPVTRLYYALDTEMKRGGFAATAFVLYSTNKLGAAGSAQLVANEVAAHGIAVRIVKVNRGGSNTYNGSVTGFPVLQLDYLDTGFMALVYRASTERSLAEMIRNPQSDFELATSYIAQWIRKFASQPEVMSAVGGDIGPILDNLGYKTPARNRYVHLTEDQVRNAQLRQYIAATAERTA